MNILSVKFFLTRNTLNRFNNHRERINMEFMKIFLFLQYIGVFSPTLSVDRTSLFENLNRNIDYNYKVVVCDNISTRKKCFLNDTFPMCSQLISVQDQRRNIIQINILIFLHLWTILFMNLL